jgi:hypothetical protein
MTYTDRCDIQAVEECEHPAIEARSLRMDRTTEEPQSEGNDSDDVESGSDEQSFISSISTKMTQRSFQLKGIYSAIIVVVCLASSYVLYNQTGGSDRPDVVEHHVFDAPEMHRMLMESARPFFNKADVDHPFGHSLPEAELSAHIKNGLQQVKDMALKELPKDKADALKNTKLTSQQWADLKQMTRASRNTKVREAGLRALQVLRQNIFSSQTVIAQKMKEAMAPHAHELIELRSQLIPESFDRALGDWARKNNDTHGAWKGLLDSPENLQRMRDHEVHDTSQALSRRLGGASPSSSASLSGSLGIGGAPVGVLAVVFTVIGEILIHVDMFVPGFDLPKWAWKLIMTPISVLSYLACNNGANKYCNTIMGAMGINALDAAFVTFCEGGLFGPTTATYCKDKVHSIKQQKKFANKLNSALGAADDIFKD